MIWGTQGLGDGLESPFFRSDVAWGDGIRGWGQDDGLNDDRGKRGCVCFLLGFGYGGRGFREPANTYAPEL
jgi:hypothetical protein